MAARLNLAAVGIKRVEGALSDASQDELEGHMLLPERLEAREAVLGAREGQGTEAWARGPRCDRHGPRRREWWGGRASVASVAQGGAMGGAGEGGGRTFEREAGLVELQGRHVTLEARLLLDELAAELLANRPLEPVTFLAALARSKVSANGPFPFNKQPTRANEQAEPSQK